MNPCQACGAWRGELGGEKSPEDFISHLCDIFDEVKRVLRKDSVCWINMGSSFWGGKGQSGSRDADIQAKRHESGESLNKAHHQIAGYKQTRPSDGKHHIYKSKDLVMIPSMLAIELQRRGWYVRSIFTWWKQNSMPSSVRDRPSDSCEWVIMLTKSRSYWYDIDAERVGLSDSTLPREMRGVASSNKWVGGADGQTKHTMSQPRLSGKDANISPKQGRNLRTGDFMGMSLDAETEHAQNYLKSLHNIKRKGGIITDDEGTSVGLFCNLKGFSGLHFATFPCRFAEIFINLSVPKKCCAVCGKGWKRVVETSYTPTGKTGHEKYNTDNQSGGLQLGACTPQSMKYGRANKQSKTLGFRPDCSCDAPHDMTSDKRCRNCNANDFLASVEPCHKPGIVLDPFLGAGTTSMVAQRLGRRWIGIELSEEYAVMAQYRIEAELPLFTV